MIDETSEQLVNVHRILENMRGIVQARLKKDVYYVIKKHIMK